MRRKYKAIDINEFSDDTNNTDRITVKGELRRLYPVINNKLIKEGWSAKSVVDWFGERGLVMSVELFRVYLRDIDKENGYKRSANKPRIRSHTKVVEKQTNYVHQGATTNLPPKSADALDGPEVLPLAVDLADKTFANSGLVRPPGLSNSAWSDLQVKAAAENRKKL